MTTLSNFEIIANIQGDPKNIARGTTDPEIDSVTWIKFGNHIIHDSIYISFKLGSKMVPLALVAKLATR